MGLSFNWNRHDRTAVSTTLAVELVHTHSCTARSATWVTRHDKRQYYTISLTYLRNSCKVLHSRTSQAPVCVQRKLERNEHGEQCRASHHRRRRRHAVLHGGRIVAFEDVHQNTRRLGVAGLTGVIARVTVRRPRHLQPAFPVGEVSADVHALIDVVVDHTEVVVPEEIRRHLRGFLHQAV